MAQINIGARIRYFRHLRGLSQEQLALQAGINPAFLGHLERGLKSPTITTLDKLVRALGITFEELFAEEPSVSDPAREDAMQRLLLLVRDLPAEQLDDLSDIIQAILKFQQAPQAVHVPSVQEDTQQRHPDTGTVRY